MKNVLIGLLASTIAALSAGPASAQRGRGLSQFEAASHGWLFDYRKAKDLARQTDKPLMVVFRCVP
jgi:hypothetical protein